MLVILLAINLATVRASLAAVPVVALVMAAVPRVMRLVSAVSGVVDLVGMVAVRPAAMLLVDRRMTLQRLLVTGSRMCPKIER